MSSITQDVALQHGLICEHLNILVLAKNIFDSNMGARSAGSGRPKTPVFDPSPEGRFFDDFRLLTTYL
jgi:hypothetical protein